MNIGLRADNVAFAKDSLAPTRRRLPIVERVSLLNPIQPRPEAEPTTSGPATPSQNPEIVSHFGFAAADAAAPVVRPATPAPTATTVAAMAKTASRPSFLGRLPITLARSRGRT
jgi:hypothetical protein